MATEEEIVHENVCTVVLKEVGIRHPIVFNTFNLCDMHKAGKLRLLSVSMLCSICEHFDIEVMNIKGQCKAPYLSLLGELLVYRLIKLTFQPLHSSILRLKKKKLVSGGKSGLRLLYIPTVVSNIMLDAPVIV